MRAVVVALGLLPSLTVLAGAQVYREPFVAVRPVTVIEPARGMPLLLSRGALSLVPPSRLVRLSITVSSGTTRTIPISGIMLRVAIGPTPDGMMTFRMRPVSVDPGAPALLPEPPARLSTGDGAVRLTFALAREDHAPPPTALRRNTLVVVTVERIEGEEGQVLFENPDASELLWEALGRPSFHSQ